jgi:hypothetical protein
MLHLTKNRAAEALHQVRISEALDYPACRKVSRKDAKPQSCISKIRWLSPPRALASLRETLSAFHFIVFA